LIFGAGIPVINRKAGINRDNFRIAEGWAACRLPPAACRLPPAAWRLTPGV
jgi:hypothetical protein